MVKIGTGLLPAVDSFMSMVTRNLPGIEAFGAHIAHLIAPAVTGFFRGLEAVLKEMLGPLRGVTEAVGAGVIVFMSMLKLVEIFKAVRLAWTALQVVLEANPWILIATAVAALAVLIVKYNKRIWDVIKSTWDKVGAFFKKFWPELTAAAVLFFGPVTVLMIALAALIIKYHKDILSAVEKTWDAISKYTLKIFDDITKGVEKLFDNIKKAITTGFDAWWKSHGEEVEAVWKVVWKVVSDYFKIQWDIITTTLKVAWALIGPFLEVALSGLEMAWKITWALLSEIFKNTWDVIAAVVKVAVAGVTAVIKIAWDLIVGVFNVFLDLVTGHWSKAWTDIQNAATQVWNAIQQYLGTVWDTISGLAIQVWNNISSFFTTTLNAI